MFDDLRPKGSAFDDDETLIAGPTPDIEETIISRPRSASRRVVRARSSGEGEVTLLGMTAVQRLVIAIMLFLNVAVLGCFLLLATGSVVLPGM
jgi:hypothetical protein